MLYLYIGAAVPVVLLLLRQALDFSYKEELVMASLADYVEPVSYTHLDVYKRQSLTGIPVISRRAGKRKSILRSFRTHKDHAPFFYIIDLSKKRFNRNNQKIQKDT